LSGSQYRTIHRTNRGDDFGGRYGWGGVATTTEESPFKRGQLAPNFVSRIIYRLYLDLRNVVPPLRPRTRRIYVYFVFRDSSPVHKLIGDGYYYFPRYLPRPLFRRYHGAEIVTYNIGYAHANHTHTHTHTHVGDGDRAVCCWWCIPCGRSTDSLYHIIFVPPKSI